MILLAAWAVAATLAGAGPPDQDTLAVAAERLSFRLDPAGGAMELRVRGDGDDVVHTAHLPGLILDGEVQSGFTATGPGGARNDALAVGVEVLGPRAIAVTWTPRDGAIHGFRLELMSDDGTRYYGTGERFNALNQRGYVVPLRVEDRYGNKGVGAHKPVPFFMSSRGFGVWIDSWAEGSLDLSGTHRHLSHLDIPDERLRVVFLAGPGLSQILEVYTGLTGRSPVPPPWAFGLWKSRDVHHNADSVYADVERLREYGIPASVLVLDSPWETGYNTFEVNRVQFPDPDAMFARVRELGFEVCVWLTPFVNDSSVQEVPGLHPEADTYAEAAAAGYLVDRGDGTVATQRWWKGRGGLVDFTDPAAAAWWHRQLSKTKRWGIRAFKVDDGEGNFVPDATFADGTPSALMKNRYAVVYDSVMQAYVDEELDGEGVLSVRSGYTGVQRYPFAWAGDNQGSFDYQDGLPSVILAGQNAAMSGISLWGHDIAGYAGVPSKDVFIRWTQFGTFSPLMQVHMTSNWGPWDFDQEALEIFRRFARLRIRLFPYLYDAVHETARTGLPVIRPMALAFPGDPEAAERSYQYMFGPDLLVAPVYQPVTRRSVYLPSGRWIDFWSGELREGPVTVEVEAPLDRIPLFVRAGAIIPMLPQDVETLVRRNDAMAGDVVALDERRVLEVWPGGSGSVRTWDGLAAALETDDGRVVLRVGSETARPVEIRLRGRALPGLSIPGAEVRVDGSGVTVISFPVLVGRRTVAWGPGGTP